MDSALRRYEVTWTQAFRDEIVWGTSARDAVERTLKRFWGHPDHQAPDVGTVFFVSRWRQELVHEFTLEELGIEGWDPEAEE